MDAEKVKKMEQIIRSSEHDITAMEDAIDIMRRTIKELRAETSDRLISLSDLPQGGIIRAENPRDVQVFYPIKQSKIEDTFANFGVIVSAANVDEPFSNEADDDTDPAQGTVFPVLRDRYLEVTACYGCLRMNLAECPIHDDIKKMMLNERSLLVPVDRVGEVVEALRQSDVVNSLVYQLT